LKQRLVVATTNPGKLAEIRACFEDKQWELLSLDEHASLLGDVPAVAEGTAAEGASFESNAIKKATEICYFTGLPTLADDSGLVIDHLGGLPGVDSSVFLGVDISYPKRISHILQQLEGLEASQRSARFVCVMAVAFPSGQIVTAHGECHGLIAHTPRGAGGFAYDPIFKVPKLGKTFAQLLLHEKNVISHRAKALEKMHMALRELF